MKIKMSENVNVVGIESFMSSFGIVPMKTAKDEGLMSFDVCKERILNLIQENIRLFKANVWDKKNRMQKLLVDLDAKKNKTVFTVRLGGKKIYRCYTELMDLPTKIEFLTKFYEGVSRGCLNKQIEDFCESEVNLANARKDKQKEKRKAKRKAEREAQVKKEAEAKEHLPQNV